MRSTKARAWRNCSGFALFGSATKGGKLYHGRVLDYMTTIGLQDAATTFIQGTGHAYHSAVTTSVNTLDQAILTVPGVATVLALICTDAPRVKVTLDGKVNFVAMGSAVRGIFGDCDEVR